MRARLKAYRQGIRDAREQWPNFGCGLTFDDPALNESYDAGVNVGEKFSEVKNTLAEVVSEPRRFLPFV